MIAQRDASLFVSVRHQNSNVNIFNMVEVSVSRGDNVTKIAKKLRLDACERYTPRLERPSVLAWAVFFNADDATPFLKSENWR